MNRFGALAYLVAEFGMLATDAGLAYEDTAGGFGPAIDNALRRLGVAEADLATGDVAAEDTPDYIALLEYYALRRLARMLAARVDVTLDSPSTTARRSQAFTQVQTLLAEAKAEVEALGYGSQQLPEMQSFRLGLDFLEPGTESG